MRKFKLAGMAALSCAAFVPLSFAQQGAAPQNVTPPAAGQQAQAGRGAGAPGAGRGGPTNVRTNQQSGVDIDRFFGNPLNTPPHLSHGGLLTHTILTAGNPYEPGAQGAVLEYRKDLSLATLLPHNATQMITAPDAYLFFVKGGEGRIDDGKQEWDLKDQTAVLVAPNAPHRITNTGDKPMTMIMITWTQSAQLKNPILVRDIDKLPWCEEDAHWNNFSKCVFGKNDGMMDSERVLYVMLQPWESSQPHTHPPGFEEIWTKISSGTSIALMGSELRKMPENSAYRVPPNGITEHSNINVTEDHTEWWLYMARDRFRGETTAPTGVGTPGGIAASATPQAGPLPSATLFNLPRPNTNVIPDGSSLPAVQVADVHPKPLK